MVSIARPRSHDVKTLLLQKLLISAFPGSFNLPLAHPSFGTTLAELRRDTPSLR